MKFKKIFIDLDGVLANFNDGFIEIANTHPDGFEDEFVETKFWETVYGNPSFFFDLKPYGYVSKLVQACKDKSIETVCILSAPSRVNTPLCMIQKRKWVDKHLGDNFPAIFTKDKYKYAAPDCLLIDDHKKNIDKWVKAGGIGFLFHPDEPIEKMLIFLKREVVL